ncbi:MAG: aspartate kinase [Christensenellaceae bacterium]|jgi:aspartate kinase|nr:aspartate kinase [Christensenellaceae bacterium]
MLKVAKFGGSSLADARQFQKVKAILLMDEGRRYVVPSAPGKRDDEDEKVTDLLYLMQKKAAQGEKIDEEFARLKERFAGIVEALELELDILPHLGELREAIEGGASPDFAASRGEYLNGIVLSHYLGWEFIDAAEVVFFGENGVFDADQTQEVLSAKLAKAKNAVIPGFYGSMPNGEIHTFSRGGSDITGAIVARACSAALYENWTDVSGFLMADPRIVKKPREIEVITYRELRELSYMGATVLHDEAIFPVRMAGIPINIRNTNEPSAPGTMIVRADESQVRGAITGIAGKKGFTAIAVEKNLMNAELGFGRRVLQALEESGVPFEHLPTGIDTMTVLCSDANLAGRIEGVIETIRRSCEPDHIEVISGLSLVATVGRGMVRYPGTAAKIFAALAEAGVNIRMIDQGSSEINIITAVESADFERAVNAIYSAFVKSSP